MGLNYQNSIGWKQNNYGNLRGAGVNWKGKIGMRNGFSEFDKPVMGVRAIFVDLNQKIKAGKDTITKMISMYAPPEDKNNTPAYIKFVASETKIMPDIKVGRENLKGIVKAIIKKEIGYTAPDSLINEAYNLAFQGSMDKAIEVIKNNSNILPVFGIILLAGGLYLATK